MLRLTAVGVALLSGTVAEGAVADALKLAQKTREYELQVIMQLELEALKVGHPPKSRHY
jgi:hypothetical protein